MAATSNTTSMNKTKKGKEKKKSNEFQWTDDEAELLLNVSYEYKTVKAADNLDWESIKNKYEDILERFKERLPKEPLTEAEKERIACGLSKNYPHTKDEVTKQVLTTKLKAIRQKYRQAVDSGRRSGHGRVVLLYYELCEMVWGGSPATEQLVTGLESYEMATTSFEEAVPQSLSSSTSLAGAGAETPSSEAGGILSDEDEDSNDQVQSVVSPSVIQARRASLDKKLNEYRQEKLKRKLPVDAQLLDCAQEDIKMKKQLVERMDNMDKQYTEVVQSMTRTMEKVSESISEGFSLLKMFMTPHSSMYTGRHSMSSSYNGLPGFQPHGRSTPLACPQPSSPRWNNPEDDWVYSNP